MSNSEESRPTTQIEVAIDEALCLYCETSNKIVLNPPRTYARITNGKLPIKEALEKSRELSDLIRDAKEHIKFLLEGNIEEEARRYSEKEEIKSGFNEVANRLDEVLNLTRGAEKDKSSGRWR